jgi:hypothetical protein
LISIDIRQIAKDFSVDEEIIFGRLYYHLEEKYSYKRDDGTSVSFFINDEKHYINFPYMSSVLARLRDENRKHWMPVMISIASLVISIAAFLVNFSKPDASKQPGFQLINFFRPNICYCNFGFLEK